MKFAERIVMVTIVVFLIGGGVWGYQAVSNERSDFRDRVAAGEFEIRTDAEPSLADADIVPGSEEDWRRFYPVTYDMKVGGVPVQASIADTQSTRLKGLSDTPYLPEQLVKLFAFGVPGQHSIWMKDMNYAIDILWADEAGVIVHIEEAVSPDTFPASFSSPTPAWFVVETNAGFVAKHNISLGDTIVIPQPE